MDIIGAAALIAAGIVVAAIAYGRMYGFRTPVAPSQAMRSAPVAPSRARKAALAPDSAALAPSQANGAALASSHVPLSAPSQAAAASLASSLPGTLRIRPCQSYSYPPMT